MRRALLCLTAIIALAAGPAAFGLTGLLAPTTTVHTADLLPSPITAHLPSRWDLPDPTTIPAGKTSRPVPVMPSRWQPVRLTGGTRGFPTSAQWAALRNCESGADYANKRNPNFRGAYQAAWSTWGNYDGYHDPADAPPSVQDRWALELYLMRGAQPWPVCGRLL